MLERDLDWFWRSFLDETWTLDQAVARVDSGADQVTVIVEDQGRMPMPVLLRVTYGPGFPWMFGSMESGRPRPSFPVDR